MKILYLTPGCFDKGGISRYSRYQISALREILGEESIRVFSLLGPGEDAFEEPFSAHYVAGGTKLIQKHAFVMHAFANLLSYAPDAILSAHVHFSGLALLMAKLVGASTIVNVYGGEVWSGFRPHVAWGLSHSTHIVADCHFTARYIEEDGRRSKGSTEVVWDCVDIDKFSPGSPRPEVLNRYGIPDPRSAINLLTLGRMSADTAYKGYERLLEVFLMVAKEIPELHLIYGGRGEMVEVLRTRAKNAGVQERIHFTGMIHEADLSDVYRSGHMFSLVSDRGKDRGEGIPLTPLEAAGCGLPVILGNQDGSQEAVIEGVNGYVIDPFDLEAHGKHIVELARDLSLCSRMGQAARSRIEREFSYSIFRAKHRVLLEKWFPGYTCTKERK